MHQFRVKTEELNKEIVKITGDEAHHLINVLRIKQNNIVSLFDGLGTKAIALVEKINKDVVILRIKETRVLDAEPSVEITLYQSLLKKDKFELIIQKATELGIKRVVPIVTERTVVNIKEDDITKKHQRWQKIIQEASKQSNRSCVCQIFKPVSYKKSLEELDHDLVLILWEGEENKGIKPVINKNKKDKPLSIGIFIGPEGGWSVQEVENAKNKKIVPVSLGPRILRAETAGLAALTVLLYEFGDLGG